MTMARAHLVDVSVTRWYHCITRCVRRAFLLSEVPLDPSQEPFDRKEWIENRLHELADIFAVAVGGFSVMGNHLHVLVRLDPEVAAAWSDEEVVRRWGSLFPPRDKSRKPLPVSSTWVEMRLKDTQWVANARSRLQSLSWFMKCLKEPLSRLANRQDKARGAFFEERFKSVAILDDESLLATCAYIDLNPIAAGIADVPEASPYTSITTRVDHVKEQRRTADLQAAEGGSIAGLNASAASRNPSGSARSKIAIRLIRHVKECSKDSRWAATCSLSITPAASSATGKPRSQPNSRTSSIDSAASADRWQARLQKLKSGRLLGRFFAASRDRLREVAARLEVHHLANFGGCPA